MRALLCFDADGALCRFSCGQAVSEPLLHGREVELLCEERLLSYEMPDEDLYAVCFSGGDTLWVKARDMAAAIVTACLSSASFLAREVTEVQSYDLSLLAKGGKAAPITESLSPLLSPLLACLCTENRALCAHAIAATAEVESLDALHRLEVAQNTPITAKAPPATTHDSAKMQARMAQLLGNLSLIEIDLYHGALRPEMQSAAKESDPLALLTSLSLFERLCGFDAQFPYTLYTALLSNTLAPYHNRYEKLCAVLA